MTLPAPLADASSWIREHLTRSLVIVFMLGLVIGAISGQSGSGAADLEAQLAAAEEEAADDADAASEQISSLESAKSSLEEQVLDLSDENSNLSDRLIRLNAKRAMPSLIGLDQARAFALERKFGWNVNVERRFSEARAGIVIDQSPSEGTMMRYRAPFTVVVAKPIPRVPDLSGLAKDVAAQQVRSGGWNVAFIDQVSDGKPGRVISASPSPGSSLLPGETITLTISKKAPPPAAVVDEPDESSSSSGCTPGYSPCLPPAPDYDCAGGSGDGPKYTGYVTVTGSDPYGLDSDNDGAGCES